mgnify:CR=1 FL=1
MVKAKTSEAAKAAYAAAVEMGKTTWRHEENALLIAKRAKHHFASATREELLAFHAELSESAMGGNARLFGLEAGILREGQKSSGADVAEELGI